MTDFYVPENLIKDKDKAFTSPCGKYLLNISTYKTQPGAWDYTRGLVYHITTKNSEPALIADIKRNYSTFWYTWVTNAKGEFLLCGEDYQGYNVIDLITGKNYSTIGEFCWAKVVPNPSSTLLAVTGCYWSGPYELWVYDFTEPTKLPLSGICLDDCTSETIEKWEDDENVTLEDAITYRISDGKSLDDICADGEVMPTESELDVKEVRRTLNVRQVNNK